MELYSYFRSSASYRVRIALNLKGLQYNYRAVHLLENAQHSPEYTKLNPSHQVPTLIDGQNIIAQSVAIIDYLDHVKESPRLFPKEAVARAHVLQACEIINSGAQPLHNLRVLHKLETDFKITAEQKDEWSRYWISAGLDAYQALISKAAGKYSFGSTITAADCFLVPHMTNARRFKVDLAAYPLLSKIDEELRSIEAFKRSAPEAQPDFPQASK